MKRKIFGLLTLAGTLVASTLFNTPYTYNETDVIGPAPVGEFSENYKGEYLGRRNANEDNITVPKKIIIHYQLDDKSYENKRFWIWAGDYDPKQEFEATGMDDYGMIFEFDTSVIEGPHDKFGFLVFEAGNLDGSKTQDCFIDYAEFPADGNGTIEVWGYPEADNSISIFKTIEETMGGKIVTADFLDWKKIHVTNTEIPTSYRLYAFTNEYYDYKYYGRQYHKERFVIASNHLDGKEKDFDINFMAYAPASVVYYVEVDFPDANKQPSAEQPHPVKTKGKYINATKLYQSKRFNKFYTYDGTDLGAVYTKEKTSFKLWAPMCARVTLNVYNAGTTSKNEKVDTYRMNLTKGGVWSCEVAGDLNGKYYTYTVANLGGENEVCDPYAKSAGLDGVRGMILDFATTNPKGWDEIPEVWDKNPTYDLKAPNDLTVYEIHIRDLTMHKTWNGTSKAGTYKAFIEKGTSYSENGVTVKTGFDHIEELGVNAVQILPFFDQANKETDKNKSNNKIDSPYNWGYNPLNYNVPEGVYSLNPEDGALRVKEVKEMVQAFASNKNHTRVIMDVVYNHVGSVAESNFTKIMPQYYFRTTPEGAYMNRSGCGNDVRSEAKMMRKFIVESVCWWAKEYKIKGFRFDLMGLIDVETMRQVKDELYKIDPDIVCYGEGWPWADTLPSNGANTDRVYSELYPSEKSPGILGGFSDSFRDSIRGGNGWGVEKTPDYGFIAQGSEHVGDKAAAIAEGLLGKHKNKGGNPYQTINYASCHDNYSLVDQLYYTLGDHTNEIEPDYEVLTDAIIAVQSAVAFSNGIAFFNGGEEVLRSKVDENGLPIETTMMYGKRISHNSYKSSDATNVLDYSNKISIEYKGETHDTTGFYNRYLELIKQRGQFQSRFPYGSDASSGSWYPKDSSNSEANPNGATALGSYVKYNGSEYWMFLCGTAPTTIGFDSAHKSTCIYNSLEGENTYSTSNNTITLSPRQFVVFKAN